MVVAEEGSARSPAGVNAGAVQSPLRYARGYLDET